jgi:small GTP-binding protein
MTEDDMPPVLMVGFAPDERSKDRRCISGHECKVLADSYGFQHRDVDFDSDMAGLLQKMVADIRRDEYEASEDTASTPLVDMIVFGDVFVGKTCLVNRLLTGDFEGKYISSSSSRPRKVKVVVDDVLTILRLRDTPGSSYQSMITPEFMNTIHSVVIMYDTTSRATFEAAQNIRRLVLTAKQEKRIYMILVGNKNDEQFLVERQVSYDEALAVAKSWKCPFFEVSCKASNVDHIFKEAIREYRLTFNYDTVSSPKLEWGGFAQMNSSGGKFQKKWVSVRAGKLSYSTKQDSTKSTKTIEINGNMGVIEGNHDKGSLLILSVIGITPHIQYLLPSHADRAALADALFAELAFQRVVEELIKDVVKTAITSVASTPEDSNASLCILAHGRMPSLTANNNTTNNGIQPNGGNNIIHSNVASSSAASTGSGSTPFRRNR